MSTLENLSCPIDAAPLSRVERVLKCPHGHTYDLAKTGYINLLPVQNKRSKDPGDSKEMVAARQAFLNQQHYLPIVNAVLSSWPQGALSDKISLLDAGCGEGYYLDKLACQLSSQGIEVTRTGLDISKWAILAASKRDKDVSWVVGSNASLPMPEQSFDAVLCLFGFPVFDEFSRVLKDNGLLLLVESGADHLIELRRILYPAIHDYKPTFTSELSDFDLILEQAESFTFNLDSQAQIQQLLSMTPHIHKASYDGRAAAMLLNAITLTADIKLRWYRKKIKEVNHV
ncbi:methyltransferase domain-containing protein [Marinomonas sp. M1K-6]|uniref:Methyltransferase domain-containing protein n=1 Tax=Marinomonas profundi TaxID=2726122 RepID=A0A847R232_9GAMM|nr:methyltransferase domain-containing protein [Marinomonas profundi]NLQ17855.1 methyltransferase domain-containing protein [Marinomonas profundi]UDV03488.1 methyltransferase domain-containing protein [Marinomonas profundi]